MGKIKNIIFDLDETLIKLPVDWPVAYEEVRKYIRRNFTNLLNLLAELWNTEDYHIVSRIIEKFELEALDYIQILDNSQELILDLSKHYRLSLVTLQGRKIAEEALRKLGIRKTFEIVITRDDAPTRLKQLQMVLEKTSFKPKETIVVGDKLNDVESALKLKCWAVLVDRRNEAELLNGYERRIFVIKNLSELESLLNSLQ
ncbi:MAG: hypothetical protein DRJ38_00830 [Thermoprotei archaeon]|nr:MAG: hypothetical protein DRJ38_00830 [Thermoprotei archaeon]